MTRGRARLTAAKVRQMVVEYESRMVGGVKAKWLIVPPNAVRSGRKAAAEVGLVLEVSRRIRPDQAFICGVIPNTGVEYLLRKRR